jgi:hypothetical protein
MFSIMLEDVQPPAVPQGCLAQEIASGMGGAGGDRGFQGPACLMTGALVSSDRSYPPGGPSISRDANC